jgi:hypothetical protein
VRRSRGGAGVDLVLERDCRDILLAPEVAIWTIIDTAAVCGAIILIDISGDANGLVKALLTASLPVLCIPLVLRVVSRRYYMVVVTPVASAIASGSTNSTSSQSARPFTLKSPTTGGISSSRNAAILAGRGRVQSQVEADTESRYLENM